MWISSVSIPYGSIRSSTAEGKGNRYQVSIPYGSIRSSGAAGAAQAQLRQFQFLMVRLEVAGLNPYGDFTTFQFLMVRLEGKPGRICAGTVVLVSIPYGSIRRNRENRQSFHYDCFNSLWFD